MESLAKKIGITDRRLTRLFGFYIAAAAGFTAILVIAIFVRGYALSYDETVRNLDRIRMGLVRIERATKDMQQSISTIETVIPVHLFTESPERQILAGLDELKVIMKNSTVTISSEIAQRDNRVALPVSVKGVVTDYSLFVNSIGELQAMRFPFITIATITMNREEAAPGTSPGGHQGARYVTYEVVGELATLPGDGAGGQGVTFRDPRQR